MQQDYKDRQLINSSRYVGSKPKDYSNAYLVIAVGTLWIFCALVWAVVSTLEQLIIV